MSLADHPIVQKYQKRKDDGEHPIQAVQKAVDEYTYENLEGSLEEIEELYGEMLKGKPQPFHDIVHSIPPKELLIYTLTYADAWMTIKEHVPVDNWGRAVTEMMMSMVPFNSDPLLNSTIMGGAAFLVKDSLMEENEFEAEKFHTNVQNAILGNLAAVRDEAPDIAAEGEAELKARGFDLSS